MPRANPAGAIHPSDAPTVEDLIFRAVEDERKHGPAGLTFTPVYSFVSAVAHMARGQERQAILDALPKEREPDHNESWYQGYNAALAAVIRILVERSQTH
jgi:hypothetical protein